MTDATTPAELHVDWHTVWQEVATQLSKDRLVPKFLTEDGIRVATLRALVTQIDIWRGADVEYPAVSLGGTGFDRLDLVIQLNKTATVVEFKYPREPRQTQPPWPDHLGSFFSDTYRLGSLASGGQVEQALQVLVSGLDFLGFLRRTATRCHLSEQAIGDRTPRLLTLTLAGTSGLAATTRGKIQKYTASWEIEATRTEEIEIAGKGLWLVTYTVSGKHAAE
jgi:hypothetical protein